MTDLEIARQIIEQAVRSECLLKLWAPHSFDCLAKITNRLAYEVVRELGMRGIGR
jgi:hypothetical protein